MRLQGDQLGLLVQNLVTVVAGFAIAFAYGWRMTFVVLAVVPLMIAAGWFQVGVSTTSSRSGLPFTPTDKTAHHHNILSLVSLMTAQWSMQSCAMSCTPCDCAAPGWTGTGAVAMVPKRPRCALH